MFNIKLGSLMGVIWGNFHSITDDELYMTRRKLTNVRRQAVAGRNAFEYRMEPSLEICRLPQNIVNNLNDGRLFPLFQIFFIVKIQLTKLLFFQVGFMFIWTK